MHRKGAIIVGMLIFSMTEAICQHISHQVMVPAAGLVSVGGKHFSQTIGEPAIVLLSSDNYILTQGFQQPPVKLMNGIKPDGNGVNAYPNPMTDIIWFELFGDVSRTFTISIINTYGNEVYREELKFTGKFWFKDYRSVSDLKPGLYLVRFLSKDGAIRRTIKVEKM